MRLVKEHSVNGHNVKIYDDRGHYVIYLDNEPYANVDINELQETLNEIAEETS